MVDEQHRNAHSEHQLLGRLPIQLRVWHRHDRLHDCAASGTNEFATKTGGTWTYYAYKANFKLQSKTKVALRGYNDIGKGVVGYSVNDYGVYGYSVNTNGIYGESVEQAGLAGRSTDSKGIEGYSTNNYALYGTSQNSNALFATTYSGGSILFLDQVNTNPYADYSGSMIFAQSIGNDNDYNTFHHGVFIYRSTATPANIANGFGLAYSVGLRHRRNITARSLFGGGLGERFEQDAEVQIQTMDATAAPTTKFSIGGSVQNTLTSIQSPTVIGSVIKGASTQTADLQEWQNNGGSILASVNASGSLFVENGNRVCTAANGLCVSAGNTTAQMIAAVNNTIGVFNIDINASNVTNAPWLSSSSSGWTNNSQNTTTTLNVGIGTTTPGGPLDVLAQWPSSSQQIL